MKITDLNDKILIFEKYLLLQNETYIDIDHNALKMSDF